jgi:hypothetical protein
MVNATTYPFCCFASQRPCSVTAIRPRPLDNGVGSSTLSYIGCLDHGSISVRRASLYRWLLPRLSSPQIEWALARWVRATLTAAEEDAIALDGKTLRGAALPGQAAPHLLGISHAWEPGDAAPNARERKDE